MQNSYFFFLTYEYRVLQRNKKEEKFSQPRELILTKRLTVKYSQKGRFKTWECFFFSMFQYSIIFNLKWFLEVDGVKQSHRRYKEQLLPGTGPSWLTVTPLCNVDETMCFRPSPFKNPHIQPDSFYMLCHFSIKDQLN